MEKISDQTEMEYNIFIETFFFLKLIGLWKPTIMKRRWLHLFYNIYTVFIAISISLIAIGTFLDIVTAKENVLGHFSENWFLTAIVCHTLFNGVNVAFKRKQIINLLRTKIIIERWTSLRDVEEIKIIETSKRAEQNVLRYWIGLVLCNALMNILNPIIGDNPDNNLIIQSWIPCDRRVSSCFWIIYSQQVVSWIAASITNVTAGTIILNFIERICSHIRIFQHRLTSLPNLVRTGVISTAEEERIYLNECILDHQNIYVTAKEISRIFYISIFMQFVLIFSILCTNIYILSIQPLFSSAFMAVCLFLCCMLTQFFLFCWWGYKLTQMSNDISYTIFSMDWLELRQETRTNLRFIMLNASKSIPLFDNFIVELSPEMFLKLLKISYSAFNLLQTRN